MAQQTPAEIQHKGRGDEDEDEDEEKEVPGAYNPQEYADLPVSQEIREIFEYIGRYKP